jgi:hypothetical protein
MYTQERNGEAAAEAFHKYLAVGTAEDAPSRKDAEERLQVLEAKPRKKPK